MHLALLLVVKLKLSLWIYFYICIPQMSGNGCVDRFYNSYFNFNNYTMHI